MWYLSFFSLFLVQMGWAEGSPSRDRERRKWSSFTHLKIKHLTGSFACVSAPRGLTLTHKHSHIPFEMWLCNRAAFFLRTHTYTCASSQRLALWPLEATCEDVYATAMEERQTSRVVSYSVSQHNISKTGFGVLLQQPNVASALSRQAWLWDVFLVGVGQTKGKS